MPEASRKGWTPAGTHAVVAHMRDPRFRDPCGMCLPRRSSRWASFLPQEGSSDAARSATAPRAGARYPR